MRMGCHFSMSVYPVVRNGRSHAWVALQHDFNKAKTKREKKRAKREEKKREEGQKKGRS